MPAIEVSLEFLSGGKWIGRVSGPRGGREFTTPGLDEALDRVRAACVEFGLPLPPSPPLPAEMPPPPLQPAPRPPRGRPRNAAGD